MAASSVRSDVFADLWAELRAELVAALDKHAPMNSHHEAYAVILEELDEYWEHVRLQKAKREQAKIRRELIQVAAMALRAILDVCEAE